MGKGQKRGAGSAVPSTKVTTDVEEEEEEEEGEEEEGGHISAVPWHLSQPNFLR